MSRLRIITKHIFSLAVSLHLKQYTRVHKYKNYSSIQSEWVLELWVVVYTIAVSHIFENKPLLRVLEKHILEDWFSFNTESVGKIGAFCPELYFYN